LDIGPSHVALARGSQVRGPKHERETNGSGPESNSSRQCVLCVSAKQELFRQPYKNEGQGPQRSPAEQPGTVQEQHSKGVSAKRGYQPDQQAHYNKAQKNSLPERFPEGLAQTQTIIVPEA